MQIHVAVVTLGTTKRRMAPHSHAWLRTLTQD